ncbi:MAG: hypothetical protein IPI99_08170 [Saprospiraceae bacterium]|nr:hypothetical protein [Saprospiraceae bacterium]
MESHPICPQAVPSYGQIAPRPEAISTFRHLVDQSIVDIAFKAIIMDVPAGHVAGSV